MTFDNIVGQGEIIERLKKQIANDKLGHAYMLIGEKGIGKRKLAKIFSKTVMCEHKNACGNCLSCNLLEGGSNPDFKVIDEGNNKIKIESVRAIQNDVMTKPMYSSNKIYLIANAHTMTVQAQNCLLKLLEEPPEYVMVILTVEDSLSILDTINSRVSKYILRRNTKDDILLHINEKYQTIEHDKLEFAVNLSDGIIGTAEEFLRNEEMFELRNEVVSKFFTIVEKKEYFFVDFVNYVGDDKKKLEKVILILMLIFRDILVYKATKDEKLLINYDKKDIIIENLSRFGLKNILESINVLNKTNMDIKSNANFNLSLEVMFFRLQEELIDDTGYRD